MAPRAAGADDPQMRARIAIVAGLALVLGGCAAFGRRFANDDDDDGPVAHGPNHVEPTDVTGPDAPRSPLLAEVGQRSKESAPAYALRVLAALGLHPPAALMNATTGPELLAAVKPLIERAARPLAGDLLFFDDGEVVAIATTSHGDTTEFVYVRGGVIRRGVVTPSRPGRKRDEGGRALNTFVRPWARSDGSRQKYLAGEIFDGVLRLEQLVAGNRAGAQLH